MKKKSSPKRDAINCHAVVSLLILLRDYLDDFLPESEISEKVKKSVEELAPLTDELLFQVYKIPEISSGTYINELATKIDTVVRKNYERMTP